MMIKKENSFFFSLFLSLVLGTKIIFSNKHYACTFIFFIINIIINKVHFDVSAFGVENFKNFATAFSNSNNFHRTSFIIVLEAMDSFVDETLIIKIDFTIAQITNDLIFGQVFFIFFFFNLFFLQTPPRSHLYTKKQQYEYEK
jgi:hypothetical protein